MYTIKEAAARTGVGAPLIRAWERRYGVVSPARTRSGYRMYDEVSLRTLVAMRSLVDAGWTASEAARAIRSGEVAIDDVAAASRTDGPGDLAPAIGAARRADLVARFVSAAEDASTNATEAALDEILGSGSFEAVVDDLLLPAAAALGDAWAMGRLSVAGEHAASAAVLRRLAAVYQGAGIPGRASVIVGLPPGSRHELGALAFAAALRRRGVGVLYLGPDVPVDGWLDAVRRTRAGAVVVGVVTQDDRGPAWTVVNALVAVGMPLIALGGAAAPRDGSVEAPVVVVPDRVVEAAEAVARAIGRRRR